MEDAFGTSSIYERQSFECIFVLGRGSPWAVKVVMGRPKMWDSPIKLDLCSCAKPLTTFFPPPILSYATCFGSSTSDAEMSFSRSLAGHSLGLHPYLSLALASLLVLPL